MYIEHVPNRNSPPAILLRESFYEQEVVNVFRELTHGIIGQVLLRLPHVVREGA